MKTKQTRTAPCDADSTKAKSDTTHRSFIRMTSATLVLASVTLFGVAVPAFAAESDGTVDGPFQVAIGTGADQVLSSVAIQADGRIIVLGYHNTFNGVAAGKITRLNTDGTTDTAFANNVGIGPNGQQAFVSVQTDGKILTAGQQQFWQTTFNPATPGTPLRYFSRLNADGTLDTAFSTNLIPAGDAFNVGLVILEQPDGKVVLGGYGDPSTITTGGGFSRVNADGTPDTAFIATIGNATGPTTANWVRTAAILADGDLLVGGSFPSFGPTTINNFIRLNSDGTPDVAFNNALGTAFNGPVNSITKLSTGSFAVAGSFTSFNGTPTSALAVIKPDGTLDSAFATAIGSGFNNRVDQVSELSDGTLVAVGEFTSVNGNATPRAALLSGTGQFIPQFTANLGTGFNGEVGDVAVQTNGSLVMTGAFTNINGTATGRLARLTQTLVALANPGSQSTQVNTTVSLPLTASATPAGGSFSYSATGLPPGLSIDPSSGRISGAPTSIGTYSVTATALHTTGHSASQTFNWSVTAVPVPVTLSTPDQSNLVGDTVQVPIVGSGAPTQFSAVGLPAGLSINTQTGVISGKTTTVGRYIVTITASNATGNSATSSFTWDVRSAPAPAPAKVNLAYTGSTVVPWLTAVAALFLLAGSALIARATLRRRAR